MHHALRGFIPFGICFLILFLIWYSHYKFFRRYGLHDLGTIAINGTLLFVILYYVYPLKFLFTVLASGWIGGDDSAFGTAKQMRELMLLYGSGFIAVYLLFTALHWNAWRQRIELHLNPTELFLTRSSMLEYSLMALVGFISCVLACTLPVKLSGIAGFTYFLLWPIGHIHGRWEHRRLDRLRARHL